MPLDAQQIQAIIPHRPPFLLVDRILELEPGVRIVGEKRFPATEPFYAGHFPGNPVTPGVLVIEALAQAGAVAILSLPENKGKLPFFAGIDGVKFRKPVLPGDLLRLEVKLVAMRRSIGKGEAQASVAGAVVATGTLTFFLVDPPPHSLPHADGDVRPRPSPHFLPYSDGEGQDGVPS